MSSSIVNSHWQDAEINAAAAAQTDSDTNSHHDMQITQSDTLLTCQGQTKTNGSRTN